MALVSAESKYHKMVEADNHIFPECLQLTVNAFEQSESTGLVSSYWLMGNTLFGSGIPYDYGSRQNMSYAPFAVSGPCFRVTNAGDVDRP